MNSVPPELLGEILAHSPAGYALFTGDFQLLYTNSKFEKIFGYSQEQLLGRQWLLVLQQKFSRSSHRQLLRWFQMKLTSSKRKEGFIVRLDGLPRMHVHFHSVEKEGQNYIAVSLYETRYIENSWERHYHENMTSDIELARRIQKNINNFTIDTIEGRYFEYNFASLFFPASVLSGDIINMKQVNRRYFTLFLGDGRGHGIAAALYSSLIYSYMNMIAKKISTGRTDIGRLMRAINTIAHADFSGIGEVYFFTGALALIDGNEKTMDLANAGHPPVFLIRDNMVTRIKPSGPVVGVLPRATYDYHRFELKHGDYFLFYTDGLYDIKPPQSPLTFDDWLYQYVSAYVHEGKPAGRLIKELRSCIEEAKNQGNITDDVSLVAMSIREKKRV